VPGQAKEDQRKALPFSESAFTLAVLWVKTTSRDAVARRMGRSQPPLGRRLRMESRAGLPSRMGVQAPDALPVRPFAD